MDDQLPSQPKHFDFRNKPTDGEVRKQSTGEILPIKPIIAEPMPAVGLVKSIEHPIVQESVSSNPEQVFQPKVQVLVDPSITGTESSLLPIEDDQPSETLETKNIETRPPAGLFGQENAFAEQVAANVKSNEKAN